VISGAVNRLATFCADQALIMERDSSLIAAVLNTVRALIVVLDPQGRIVSFNRACQETTGYSFEEVSGKHLWDALLLPEEVEPVRSVFNALTAGEFPNSFENHWVTKDGRPRLIAWDNTALVDSSGEVRWVVGAGIDITDRRSQEEALSTSQTRLAAIVDSAMDAIISVDADQRIVLFNAAAEQTFRCPASEAIGRSLDQFIPDRFRDAHRNHVGRFARTGITSRSMTSPGDLVGRRGDGEEFPIEATISQVEAAGQKIFTVILRDITERKRAEERLREQAALLDHASDAILVRDLDDKILFWNKSAETVYGWTADEVMGRDIRELLYRDDAQQFEKARQTLLERGEWAGELRQRTKSGKEIIAECRWSLVRDEKGQPKSFFAINTDVTEKKRLEAQFLRAQRMESIGTLAGGIAHDLNNMLSPILMSIRLLQARFPDADSQRLLATIRKSAERGGDLVRQVLEFARGVEGERIALQPKHIIKDVMKILKDTLPKSISLDFNAADDLWLVKGDATQLHQVLMNLCVNARDAMALGGRLSIAVENVYIDEGYARMNLDARPGRFVQITVADTGSGIHSSVIDKIFEPFFTTKEHGKGTGLGLSTVLGIVRGHGGFVTVYSEVGRGTEFKVYLPAVDSGQAALAEQEQRDVPTGRGEFVLVVDDEAGIREIAKSTLEAYGYNVLTAGDGTEAVALYAQNKEKVKVVVTDILMPHMDGPATIRALSKMNPHLRIIATSGLKDHNRVAETASLGVTTFLVKPYTADKLLNAIAEVLRRP
jgi:PAS domain S-box-containing protein